MTKKMKLQTIISVSTIKGVGRAVQLTLDDLIEGKFAGGETVAYHLSDGKALDIVYETMTLLHKM